MLYTQWCSQTQYVGRAQPGPLTALIERLTVILLEYLYLFNVSITWYQVTGNIWVGLGPTPAAPLPSIFSCGMP